MSTPEAIAIAAAGFGAATVNTVVGSGTLITFPILLAFVLSFVIVLSGTLYSSWRAATVSPLEAMR